MLKGFFENISEKKYTKNKEKVLVEIKKNIEELSKLSDNDFIQKAVYNYILKESSVENSFSLFYEGLRRVKGICAYDVQILGALALADNVIAEMKTGEGKTYVAAFIAYHHAINGRNVHVMTVNDYLAERDCKLLQSVFVFLGLKTDFLIEGKKTVLERQSSYQADVVYAKPSEFAFDYLRDHLIFDPDHKVQKKLDTVIIDEVDSILIDESRTPMVISSLVEVNYDSLDLLSNLSESLSVVFKEPDDQYNSTFDIFVNEKTKEIKLFNSAYEKLEACLINNDLIKDNRQLYGSNSNYIICLMNVLKSKYLYHKDHEYIVKDDKIILIDEQTGRLKPNSRLSDGLHQAIEHKENVTVNPDAQESGSVTMVSYVTMYKNICGMTGTAVAEADTFMSLYNLPVKKIKSNKPTIRKDFQDRFCLNKKSLYKCVLNDIIEHHKKNQPILVGTQSVEESEIISSMLTDLNIPHSVLNAKNNYKEAEIIENSGKLGAITISTSMAGRGTDIILGGIAPKERVLKEIYERERALVIESGGLRVIGVGRNLLRRMDEQLQGRSGRQGDVGESVFYVSPEDTLIKQYNSKKFSVLLKSITLEDDEYLENNMIDRSIRGMQKNVENYFSEGRKYTMRFDNIISRQRNIIFDMRDHWLYKKDIDSLHTSIYEIIESYLENLFSRNVPKNSMVEQWNIKNIEDEISKIFFINNLELMNYIHTQKVINDELVKEYIIMKVLETINNKINKHHYDSLSFNQLQMHIYKSGILTIIDNTWKNHLHHINELQKGINFRSYANKKPAEEFVKDSFDMFNEMLEILKEEIIINYCHNIEFIMSYEPPIKEQINASSLM